MGVPFVAQRLRNLTRIHEDAGLIPGLLSGLRIWCFHELWCRLQMWLRLDAMLLWLQLWHRLAATAPIQTSTPSLGTSICCGCGRKKEKKKKKKINKQNKPKQENTAHTLAHCRNSNRRGTVEIKPYFLLESVLGTPSKTERINCDKDGKTFRE